MEENLMTALPTDSLMLDQSAVGNLQRIENLLSSLWAQPKDDRDKPSSIRACMGNLIVYLEGEEDRNHVLQVISEVVPTYPSRVILMFAYPEQPEKPIEVSVSAQCWLEGPGREQICSEQIQIRAAGAKVRELPGIVIPLLVSDVPVHLWWRDRFLERLDLFEKFTKDIDHAIYEGLYWDNLIEKTSKVLDLTRSLRGKVAITNFNWSRLQPWQQRIAQFFDQDAYREACDRLSRVSIRYHASREEEKGRFFQALLLCGWMAGQLGWTPKSGTRGDGAACYHFEDKKQRGVEVSIEWEMVEKEAGKGIQKVRLDFDNENNFTYTIERDRENQLLIMTVQKNGVSGLPQKVRHVSASQAILLLRSMAYFKSGDVFERAFANAVESLKMSGE